MINGGGVADGRVHELDAGRQIPRARGGGAVHLGIQRVENAHARAAGQERLDEMAADEAGAAGDEHGGRDHDAVNLASSAR